MKLDPSEIKKIVIFRALQIGDLLCSIPAIRALRHAYPNAKISLIGLPWAKMLVNRFPDYFDSFIEFSGFPGLPEKAFHPGNFVSFLQQVQDEQFDLALQMQGNGSIVNPLVELFGAKFTGGFFREGHYYNNNGLFVEYPDYGHEVERHLKLMEHLEIPLQGKDLEFPLYENDYKEYQEADLNLEPATYVCIHPGARGMNRRWPTEHFARLADLVSEKGLTAVLTGTQEEMDLVDQVAQQMNYKPVIAAGKTSLGAVAVLIKNAAGLISNCTGVSHIAAALKTKSIVIGLEEESYRWAPLNRNLHRLIEWTKTPEMQMVISQTRLMLEESNEAIKMKSRV